MPSFSTEKDNFSCYYTRQTLTQSQICLEKSYLPQFIKIMVISTISTIVIGMLWMLVGKGYIPAHFMKFYTKNQIVYINEIIQFIYYSLFTIIISLTIFSIHINGNLFSSIITKKSKLMFKILVFLFIILSIIYCLPLIYRENLMKVNVIPDDSDICRIIIDCRSTNTSFYYLYRDLFVHVFMPIILYLIMFIFYNCCSNSFESQQAKLVTPTYDKIIKSNFSVHFVDESYNIDDINDVNNVINHEEIIRHKNADSCYKAFIILLFWILFSIGNVIYYCFYNIKPETVAKNFLTIFVIFVVFMSWWKILSKSIGKHIDKLRASSHGYCFSFNYSLEFYFSVLYLNWIKAYIGFDLPDFAQFMQMILAHFVLEAMETNIKFTEKYYNISSKLLEWEQNQTCFLWQWIHFAARDGSNLEQWRIRLSMDIVTRFFASLLVSIFYILWFICIGAETFSKQYGLTYRVYYKSISYTIIYSIQDLLQYIFTFVIANKLYHFNIIECFIKYTKTMNMLHCIVIFVIYLSYFVVVLV